MGSPTIRGLLLLMLLGVLPAAESVWRQWRVSVDGQLAVSSGGTRICSLSGWPGTAEARDGALILSGRQGDVDVTTTIRIHDGVVSGRVVQKRDGRPVPGGMVLASFAAGDLAGTAVTMDGKPVLVSKAFTAHEYQHARQYVFFPEQADKRLALRLDHGQFSNLRDFRDHSGRNDMQVFLLAGDDGELAFTIDLTRSADTSRGERFTGERFAWQDDLHLHDPGSQPNRVANPSFEAGLEDWGWGVTDFADPPGRQVWALDDTLGHSGRRSIRYTVPKGFHPRMLASRAIAVEPGRPVTLSYWARTDRPGAGAHLFVWSVNWGDFPVIAFEKYTAEWQRFSATFTPKGPFVRVCLGDHWWVGADGQVDGANIWFDDVQLEDGTTAGPFSQPPMLAASDTGTAGQLLPLGAAAPPLMVDVFNTSAAPARIATTVRIQDSERRTLQESTFTSELPAWSVDRRPIALALGGARGLLRVEMQLEAGGQRVIRYGRFCLYEPIADVGRLRYGLRLEQPSLERITALQPLGVSGSLAFSPNRDAGVDRRLRDAGWMHVVGIEAKGNPLEPHKARPDAAALAAFAAWFAPLAAAHPEQLWWKTFNEPNCGGYQATPEDLVAGVGLIRERVKAVNPQAQILTPDCYNASRHGQGWLESFLAAGGSKLVDAIAIHTYRARPEDPDLDADIQSLIALKARFGLEQAPILFTEGEGYQRYTVPEIGMSPLGFWEWRMGTLGKDLGRSELTAGALMARTLLACLKNEQVKFYLSWTDSDTDDVPHATLATVNWLLARLRHATFVREFAVGDEVRAYLFTTPDGRAVAAVWSCSLPVDRGEKPGFNLALDLPPGTAVHDFMGNALPAGPLLISGRPTYLLGGTGSAAALATALEGAKADGLGTTVVDTAIRLDGAAGVKVLVGNRMPRPVQGELVVEVDGAVLQRVPLSLAAKASAEQRVPLPAAAANRLSGNQVVVSFTEAGGALNRRDERLRRLAIPRLPQAVAIDGDAADWVDVAALDLGADALMTWGVKDAWKGAADLSAKVRFGWRDDGLYLLAEVADDVHRQVGRSPETAWQQDAMQFYLDLLADGRDRPGRGYDANDETLCISDGGGTGRIWREYTPEWQVAFVKQGQVEAPCAVKRSGTTTTYEMRLPPKEIFPLLMQPGTAFGCALIIGDADAQGRSTALVTSPAGSEPHGKPELWPAAVLLP